MGRVIIGAALAAIAMFFIGFVFFGLGLSGLVSGSVNDTQAAAVQQSLAANLPRTGTYFVPSPESSSAQTVMYGQGPIATIHYNTSGFPAMDTGALVGGLIFNFIIALLIGFALLGVSDRLTDLAARARIGAGVAVAAAAFCHLSTPIYFHHSWGWAIYVFVADGAMLFAAALIIAYFLPAARSRPADAPTEV